MGKLKNADGGGKHLSTSSKKSKKNGTSTEQLVNELLGKMTNTQQKSEIISSLSNKPSKSLDVTPSKKKLKKHEEGNIIGFVFQIKLCFSYSQTLFISSAEVNSVQVEQEPTVNKKLRKKKHKSEDSTAAKIGNKIELPVDIFFKKVINIAIVSLIICEQL